MLYLFFVGNVSDVLLKFQQLTNQYNTKELPYYFPLYTIEVSVFQAYNDIRQRGQPSMESTIRHIWTSKKRN